MSKRNQKKIQKMLVAAYSDLSVDSFVQIKEAPQKNFSSIKEVLGEDSKSVKNFSMLPRIWSAFAAVATVIAIMFNVHYSNNIKYAYIYVDVNPSIELKVNKKGNVVSCRAYNLDGEDIVSAKAVVESVNKKEKLDVVIENVIKSIRDRGYFSGQYDSVLVSSANTDVFEEDYMEDVISEVDEYVKEKKICNNVVYKEVNDYEGAKEKGDQYGISPGKANYVEEIADKVVFTEAELATKNIDSIVDLETKMAIFETITASESDVAYTLEVNTTEPWETTTNSECKTTTTQVAETEWNIEQFTESSSAVSEISSIDNETTGFVDSLHEEEAASVENTTDRQEENDVHKLEIKVKKATYESGVLSVEFEKKVRWSENCIVRVTSSAGSIKKATFRSKGQKRCFVQVYDCVPGEIYTVYFEGVKRKKTENFLNCTVSFTVTDESK